MNEFQIIEAVKSRTQKQKIVAKEIGLDSIYLNKILNGKEKPGDAALRRMEQWLLKQTLTEF